MHFTYKISQTIHLALSILADNERYWSLASKLKNEYILVKTSNPPLDVFQITFKLSYETMWIFTRSFVCKYSVVQEKESLIYENSLNHDDFILKRKIMLMLHCNKIFMLLFITWYLDSLNVADKKNHIKYQKIRGECPQRSAKEQLVCNRLAAALERLDCGRDLCFYR
jgi:hypothetical protein